MYMQNRVYNVNAGRTLIRICLLGLMALSAYTILYIIHIFMYESILFVSVVLAARAALIPVLNYYHLTFIFCSHF